jgi:hypothetical protein
MILAIKLISSSIGSKVLRTQGFYGCIVVAGEMEIWLLDLNNFGLYLNKTVMVTLLRFMTSISGRYSIGTFLL